MRRIALVAVALGAPSLASRAGAEPEPSSARTVDLASGLTLAGPSSADGDVRPGLAMALRFYGLGCLYASGALGASLAMDQSDQGESIDSATLLSVAAGAGIYGESGAWTGYAGGRLAWTDSEEWPDPFARKPDGLPRGIGAGPTLGIARRIGFAWGHPMAIELSGAYVYGGLEAGLYLAGTLFPDRPL